MSAPLTMRELILQTVRDEITNELRPYRAIVTGLSAGKVQFRPIEAATGSAQRYARLRGFALTVGDVVWVIGKKNPMVLEKVQDSAPASYALDAPLTGTEVSAGQPTLWYPPGQQVADLVTAGTPTSNQTRAIYIGRARKAFSTITARVRVTTALATPTWAEVAIATGTPVIGAGTNLTRRGSLNVAAAWAGTGLMAHAIPVSGIVAGDDLWFLYGAQATTQPIFRVGLADDLQSGQYLFANTTRPSTMAADTAFSLVGATTPLAWCCFTGS